MNRASTTALRRELREADRRLYQQRIAVSAEPVVIDLVAPTPAAASRGQSWNAAAACFAAGLLLIGAGELMHFRSADGPSPSAPLVTERSAADEPRLVLAPAIASPERGTIASPERGTIAVRDISTQTVRASRPGTPHAAVKRSTRPSATSVSRDAPSRPARRGMLDRLRLRWLRKAFTSHSDL
jgi:hypothetical protein